MGQCRFRFSRAGNRCSRSSSLNPRMSEKEHRNRPSLLVTVSSSYAVSRPYAMCNRTLTFAATSLRKTAPTIINACRFELPREPRGYRQAQKYKPRIHGVSHQPFPNPTLPALRYCAWRPPTTPNEPSVATPKVRKGKAKPCPLRQITNAMQYMLPALVARDCHNIPLSPKSRCMDERR